MKRHAHGFSLVEVIVAMGILAILMTGILQTSGSTSKASIAVYDLTTASQLIESVVMDLEEEFRLDGFPSNALEGRRCQVPKGLERYRCQYDLLMLDMSMDNIAALGADAGQNVGDSPLMNAFCSGGLTGDQPVDPAIALANLTAQSDEFPEGLIAFQALLDPGFTQICGINLERMCQNTMLISSFIPTIIEQAAATTRKLVVRLDWGRGGDPDQILEIETFITAIPDEDLL